MYGTFSAMSHIIQNNCSFIPLIKSAIKGEKHYTRINIVLDFKAEYLIVKILYNLGIEKTSLIVIQKSKNHNKKD